MKKSFLGLALSLLISLPVLAALKVGDMAPDFSARGSLGGKEFNFSLQEALKKGPVVVYFFPSAYTKGCDLEAHTFSQEKDKFDAAGASIIGVSADSIARLNRFSADPDFCAGKFPVASDADKKIAASYSLATTLVRVTQELFRVPTTRAVGFSDFFARWCTSSHRHFSGRCVGPRARSAIRTLRPTSSHLVGAQCSPGAPDDLLQSGKDFQQ